MRVRKLDIKSWRYFDNLSIALDADAKLVCVVGANGTGKTHILELITACAHRLGLTPGLEISRGDPFGDLHSFSLEFFLAPGTSSAVDTGLKDAPGFADWDRTLSISSERTATTSSTLIEAGGLADSQARQTFASKVVSRLQGSSDVHFLSLDADRAYPKKNVDARELGSAYEIDWEGTEYTRGRSFKPTATLYDEWLKYFLAQENQAATRLVREIRRARNVNEAEPIFTDHFLAYRDSLCAVLPHLAFTGVDAKRKQLVFDTTGFELTFSQLSGGEREIAFLIGQIDRFRLTEGLFLLDEPELHLNADLIRAWVAYLTGTVKSGQIWLATHSLEAVEAAGERATFVLERNEATRRVDTLARLDSRPVLAALSRSVGSPAFSISSLSFVFVEGQPELGERERFRRLCGSQSNLRFIEGGSGSEVLRRLEAIQSLAKESGSGIRAGAVLDQDFLRDDQKKDIESVAHRFVLPVHEVENLFLSPPLLQHLLKQNGRPDLDAVQIVQAASDARAGSWIFQWTFAQKAARDLPDISPAAKELVKPLPWQTLDASREATIAGIAAKAGYDAQHASTLTGLLRIAIQRYEKLRAPGDMWRVCEGKQVLPEAARAIGFADGGALELAASAAWNHDPALVSEELAALRQFVTNL